MQIETARKLHQITKAHGVPLIINDRVDVALAIGAEGVHLGQDDMRTHPLVMVSGLRTNVGSNLRSEEASAERCNHRDQRLVY